jgi:hypothetical protein
MRSPSLTSFFEVPPPEVYVAERDQLRAAVLAQPEHAAASQDLALILEPDALAQSQQLTEILREGDGDHESRYLLGWLHGTAIWRCRKARMEPISTLRSACSPSVLSQMSKDCPRLWPQSSLSGQSRRPER